MQYCNQTLRANHSTNHLTVNCIAHNALNARLYIIHRHAMVLPVPIWLYFQFHEDITLITIKSPTMPLVVSRACIGILLLWNSIISLISYNNNLQITSIRTNAYVAMYHPQLTPVMGKGKTPCAFLFHCCISILQSFPSFTLITYSSVLHKNDNV